MEMEMEETMIGSEARLAGPAWCFTAGACLQGPSIELRVIFFGGRQLGYLDSSVLGQDANPKFVTWIQKNARNICV